MEPFSDEYSNLLLSKEFIVKIDAATSTPYLIKFCTSAFNTNCCVLITDTRKTWTEVLTRNEFARRWRDCNRQEAPYASDSNDEEEWRTKILELLIKTHTLGNFADISFEVVESNYSDFAFELDCETFKWRWETCFLGYKMSAEILSKHLIVPLISTNHLAFSSADPVSELSEGDLEKAVDKMGRTAKRSADIHLRNAMSKPRVATTIRRVASVLNSVPDLPVISFTADKTDLQLPISQRLRESRKLSHPVSPAPAPSTKDFQTAEASISPPIEASGQKMSVDSATDDSDEDAPQRRDISVNKSIAAAASRSPSAGTSAKALEPQPTHTSRKASPLAAEPKQNKSDSDSSPVRPVKKKPKQTLSSDDDSGAERRKQATRGGAPKQRGTRQPIKRGGKRF